VTQDVSELLIGLMSGTSLDGVDGVLVECTDDRTQVIQHVHRPFTPALSAELLSLNSTGPDELHRAALGANALVRIYTQVVSALLSGAAVEASAITAIGAHGQTVRHRPQEFDGTGYTLQLNNPALLAELTGIDVVADFRSRDVAAGGQGAPLVPTFHQAMFARPGQTVCVLNIGGISNISVLSDTAVLGFDCGPGNALMDAWCQQHTGQAFDRDGAWAARGRVNPALLETLLHEPYFANPPPKSTGRDLFNAPWLEQQLSGFSPLAPIDVQATLTELTAQACAFDVLRYAPATERLIVCGGGALNTHLMVRLQAHLPEREVSTSQAHGLPPQQVEAAAFAWLARKTVLRQTASLQSITGTRGARVLGAIYPA
jgi:anhydro-N-acetylmuramic acid kinase